MITKEEIFEIVKKATEDVWYNRRSIDPVKEQTEIITNNIFESLQNRTVYKIDVGNFIKEFLYKLKNIK